MRCLWHPESILQGLLALNRGYFRPNVNPIVDGGMIRARGILKMDHFTRNCKTAWRSNIPIPMPYWMLISTRSGFHFRALKAHLI